jgi:hypothetical protein
MNIQYSLVRQLIDAPAPRKLPPEPIASIEAKSQIRWGELMVGKEL